MTKTRRPGSRSARESAQSNSERVGVQLRHTVEPVDLGGGGDVGGEGCVLFGPGLLGRGIAGSRCYDGLLAGI